MFLSFDVFCSTQEASSVNNEANSKYGGSRGNAISDEYFITVAQLGYTSKYQLSMYNK